MEVSEGKKRAATPNLFCNAIRFYLGLRKKGLWLAGIPTGEGLVF